MKKIIAFSVCLIALLLSCTCALAESYGFQVISYNLAGKKQVPLNGKVTDFKAEEGFEGILAFEKPKSPIEVSDTILSNANEGECFVFFDLKTDSEDEPYPEIESMKVSVMPQQPSGGVGFCLGKDYRLFYVNNELSTMTDVSENIIYSKETKVDFYVEKLGTYILYYNPAVYGVRFYSDIPLYDDNGNITNPECIYKEIEGLARESIVEFPPIPQKDGYVFTGWKAWSGSGIYYTNSQPLTAVSYFDYYASWCLEDEYEPINIEINSDTITKGKENGQRITLKTNYGVFESGDAFPTEWRTIYESETDEEIKAEILSDWKTKWNIVGSEDILIETAKRIDDKTVELTLSGNSRNIYNNSQIYIEFDSSLLMPEPYEENGELIDWNDTKIQMDSDGVRRKMYKSDNAITLKKQTTPVSDGGGASPTVYYSVNFNSNGGSDIASQNIVAYTYAKEPEAPAKDGYTFDGWYSDDTLTMPYRFDSIVKGNITLYAAWKENEKDIKNDNIIEENNTFILTVGKNTATVWGEEKTSDVAPVIRKDRAMLPARFVAENLGASVEWNANGTVTVTKDDTTIIITIGSDKATVNGEEKTLDSPAFIENDRTYTPIRFISENLGAKVDWNEENQEIIITKN